MPLTPQDFVSKWKRVTAREKQIYQERFIDLCHQSRIGREVDPENQDRQRLESFVDIIDQVYKTG